MQVRFWCRIPKDEAFPDDNEDAVAIDLGTGRIAVSDGASESFDSRTWAALLAKRFVAHPVLRRDWLVGAANEYARQYDRDTLSWSKQAAFDRGSFATLLGVRSFEARGVVEVLGVGDSLGVLLDGDTYVDCFPYSNARQFKERPHLFCTNQAFNAYFASARFRSAAHKRWSTRGMAEPIVLCMTDGIAEWAMHRAEAGDPVWTTLARIETSSALEALVRRERLARTMRVDDTTLVVATLREG
jgi:hypothetical protein